jgi:hypothetical protein
MPEEPTGTETLRDGRHNGMGMDLFERRLWFGGLIVALVFIGIAILISGHRCHRRVMMMSGGPVGWGMPMGRPGMEGPPPPPWGGPGAYSFRGWGPGPWQYPGGQYEQPGQQPPAPSAPPRG